MFQKQTILKSKKKKLLGALGKVPSAFTRNVSHVSDPQGPKRYANLSENEMLEYLTQKNLFVEVSRRKRRKKGKKEKMRKNHILALVYNNGALVWSLQLVKYDLSEGYKVTHRWGLTQVIRIDSLGSLCFFVHVLKANKKEKEVRREYRFKASSSKSKKRMIQNILKTCNEDMSYFPETQEDVSSFDALEDRKDGEAEEKEKEEEERGVYNINAEDLEFQRRLCRMYAKRESKDIDFVSLVEAKLLEMELQSAREMIVAGEMLLKVKEEAEQLFLSSQLIKDYLANSEKDLETVQENIAEIRGKSAYLERSNRNQRVLLDTMSSLMGSLSVPPRVLGVLREPDFEVHTPGEMVEALETVKRVIDLKGLDARFLKMRAVAEKCNEYVLLCSNFTDKCLKYLSESFSLEKEEKVGRQRAASRTHMKSIECVHEKELTRLRPVVMLFPTDKLSLLMTSYMEVAKPRYEKELSFNFSILLKKADSNVSKTYALALGLLKYIIRTELEFWDFYEDFSANWVNDLFASSTGEKLLSFLNIAAHGDQKQLIPIQAETESLASDPLLGKVMAVSKLAARLLEAGSSFIEKFVASEAGKMRESKMARNKVGALTSFTRFPPFLDILESFGEQSETVTSQIIEILLKDMVEWLESPEVVKDLVQLDRSTVLLGRMENYFFLAREMKEREEGAAYLSKHTKVCEERFENNRNEYISFMYKKEFAPLVSYFSAMEKMVSKLDDKEEVKYQVDAVAFKKLKKKITLSQWDAKMRKIGRVIAKSLSRELKKDVWGKVEEYVRGKVEEYTRMAEECMGDKFNITEEELEEIMRGIREKRFS